MVKSSSTPTHYGHPSISTIIPIYNCSDSIQNTVRSLNEQSTSHSCIEIILVNDGSTDSTLEICQQLASDNDDIIVIDKPNGGVGSARNAGIDAAHGKYIAFLDADDTLLPGTLEAAAAFFDEHYDEIDLVTYPMSLYNEHREWSHVREQILTETGVYDLTKLQNAFALITNVNVLVKNDGSLPRFREDLAVHEDELFFMEVLLRKQKVGFSKIGAYRYYQHPGSAIATKMHPYYQFEKNISFWEELFSRYDEPAPLYLQASYLNEVNWKIRQDVFFPYHYDADRFGRALARIGALLARVDDDVILTSPRSDEFYQHYLIGLKTGSNITCKQQDGGFALFNNGRFLLCRNHATLDILKTRVVHDKLCIEGIVRTLLIEHATKCVLRANFSNGSSVCMQPEPTSFDYHEGRTKTNVFAKFRGAIPVAPETQHVSFTLEANGLEVPLHLSVGGRTNLQPKSGICSFFQNGLLVSANGNRLQLAKTESRTASARCWLANTISTCRAKRSSLKRRALAKIKGHAHGNLWLYYDSPEDGKGNTYLQFIHDADKNDGIVRKYVVHGESALHKLQDGGVAPDNLLAFESADHRYLHLNASRIITSSTARSDWRPFSKSSMRYLADLPSYDIVWIPRRINLLHEPWLFSEDRTLVDFVVSSTPYETAVLHQVYGFDEGQIIESGAPRFDALSQLATTPAKRILYAPDERSHLVASGSKEGFAPKPLQFSSSPFWHAVSAFLSSEALHQALMQHGCTLDILLPKGLGVYADKFSALQTARIHLVERANASDYQTLITDANPLVFDFAYLQKGVIYFLPDREEFAAGLNGTHRLDLSFEESFGPIAENPEGLIKAVDASLLQEGAPQPPYDSRMKGFFSYRDGKNQDRLYQALMASWSTRR